MSKKTTTIMEGGQLGEARCQAFLLNRFWVMKRSVDVDGVDFIIELANLQARFTDQLPPRLGVVQAKFSKSTKTTHYINVKYVCDDHGNPLRGFFLLVHVGKEDHEKMYLLTSKDIIDNLAIKNNVDFDCYVVGAKARTEQFEVTSKTTALDRIEAILQEQTRQDTERFLNSVHVPDFDVKIHNLDRDWLLPIPNEVAFISDTVYRLKTSIRSALYAVGGSLFVFGEILKNNDPSIILEFIDSLQNHPSIISQSVGAVLHSDPIPVFSDELPRALAIHEKRLGQLTEQGHLDNFRNLSDTVLRLCFDKATNFSPFLYRVGATAKRLHNPLCIVIMELEPGSLKPLKVTVGIEGDSDVNDNSRSEHRIVVSRSLWEKELIDGMGSFLRETYRLYVEAMNQYYVALFPQDEIGCPQLPIYFSD